MVELNRQSACACDVMFGPSRSARLVAVRSFLFSSPQPGAPPPTLLAPGDKLIGIVEQPLRRAPKGEVYVPPFFA